MTQIGLRPLGDKDFVGHMMSLQRDIVGGLIVGTIRVERTLDLLLVNHFCEFRSDQWWNLYFGMAASQKITLDQKIKSAAKLLRTTYPRLLEQHHNLEGRLDRVRKTRNMVAHAELGMSDGFGSGQTPDHIVFLEYSRAGRSEKKLTTSQAVAIEKETLDLFLEVGQIAESVARNRVSSEYTPKFLSSIPGWQRRQ